MYRLSEDFIPPTPQELEEIIEVFLLTGPEVISAMGVSRNILRGFLSGKLTMNRAQAELLLRYCGLLEPVTKQMRGLQTFEEFRRKLIQKGVTYGELLDSLGVSKGDFQNVLFNRPPWEVEELLKKSQYWEEGEDGSKECSL